MTALISRRLALAALTLGMLAGMAGRSVAGPVIDHADVGGLRTFQDVATGRVWVDMDNFFDLSSDQMRAAVEAAGFTFAAKSDVEELLFSLPLDASGTDWDAYGAIMGRAPNRELIWGSYDDGGDPDLIGWAFSFRGDTAWTFNDAAWFTDVPPNSGTINADMNIWAYRSGVVAVPEPASLVMLGIAGVGLVGLRRLRRKA